MEKLKQQLKEMIVTGLKLHDTTPEQIEDDGALFEEGLGLDSLDAVELVVLINKEFDIQIQDMEEGKTAFASINSLAQYISERQ
ncbi:MAG: phosphopantetheine-binding protein [Desulfobulbaceae bacterium]|nr:phosphopantetheine-binding protein [Desulfobulbaceae bacterium]